jgi:hypothetical protein
MIKIIKFNFNYIILFLIFASITNFFKNLNILFVRDYNERILITYNHCGGISYGYINKIKNKYLSNDLKVYIINFDINPSSESLFPDLRVDKTKNNLIFLNFKNSNKNQLKDNAINIKNYDLLDSEDNCYYYKKK